jgi:hypothetical protein
MYIHIHTYIYIHTYPYIGIYLALDASTSLGYTHSTRHVPVVGGGGGGGGKRTGSYALATQLGCNMGWETSDGMAWVEGKSIFDASLACLAVVDCIFRPNDFVSTIHTHTHTHTHTCVCVYIYIDIYIYIL